MKTGQKGFTLIELLVVIAIISTLATVVFVALDPVKRFTDSRNSRRTGDVQTILTAVHSYIVDNGGSMPAGVGLTETQIGTAASGCATLCTGAAAACSDLSTPLVKYLKSLPTDPQSGSAATTGYSIVRDANNIITVKACSAEGVTISVSR
jgi:prepilin-type N-terminal cleavage/methylation domain-containing protein